MNTTGASEHETAADPRKLVTRIAYARHRGCARSYITKLVKAGRLPLVDGKVDIEAADAALGPPQPRVRPVSRGRGGIAAPEPAQRPEAPLELTAEGGLPAYAVSRQAREYYAAQRARSELAERKGQLLRRAEVVHIWTTRITAAKRKLRGIPKRAPREIPGFTKTMVRPLLKMIDHVLRDLAGDGVPAPAARRPRRHEERDR